jgi:hypothetical protein
VELGGEKRVERKEGLEQGNIGAWQGGERTEGLTIK